MDYEDLVGLVKQAVRRGDYSKALSKAARDPGDPGNPSTASQATPRGPKPLPRTMGRTPAGKEWGRKFKKNITPAQYDAGAGLSRPQQAVRRARQRQGTEAAQTALPGYRQARGSSYVRSKLGGVSDIAGEAAKRSGLLHKLKMLLNRGKRGVSDILSGIPENFDDPLFTAAPELAELAAGTAAGVVNPQAVGPASEAAELLAGAATRELREMVPSSRRLLAAAERGPGGEIIHDLSRMRRPPRELPPNLDPSKVTTASDKEAGRGDPVQLAMKELSSMVRGATSPIRRSGLRSMLFKAPTPQTVMRPDLIPEASAVYGKLTPERVMRSQQALDENEWARQILEAAFSPQERRLRQSLRSTPGLKTSAEKIPGGLAKGKKPSDYDKDALEDGLHVELEHTDSRAIATEIAMDHLEEDPKYYDKLEEIESPHAKKAAPMSLDELYGMVAADRRLEEKKRLDAHGEHKQQPNEWEDHKQASARQPGDFKDLVIKAAAYRPRIDFKNLPADELAAYLGAPAAVAGAPYAGLGAAWFAMPSTFFIPGQLEAAGLTAKPMLEKAIQQGRRAGLRDRGPTGKAAMQGLADAYNRISLEWQRAKRKVGIKPEGWVD